MTGDAHAEARALVDALVAAGVRISARQSQLVLDAPRGAMTEALAADIRRLKPALLALLEQDKTLRFSPLQERIWSDATLNPESGHLTNLSAWRLRGDDETLRARIEAALQSVLDRHRELSLRIDPAAGEPRLAPAAAPMRIDIHAVPAGDAPLADVIAATHAPFALDQDRLFTARLYPISGSEIALALSAHELLCDRHSLDLLFAEMLAELGGASLRETSSPPHPAGDETLTTPTRLPPAPELQHDRPRPAVFTHAGAGFHGSWPQGAAAPLALTQGLSDHAAFTAAAYALWRAFLLRISGGDDIAIALPKDIRAHDGAIGCYTDVAFDVASLDLTQSLRDAARTAAARLAGVRGAPSFDAVMTALAPPRDASRTPISQAMFIAVETAPPVAPGLVVGRIALPARSVRTDLTLTVDAASGAFEFGYASDLYSPAQAAALFEAFSAFATAAFADPNAPLASLPMMDDPDREELLSLSCNLSGSAPRPERIDMTIARMAAAHPGAKAIICNDCSLSYADLAARIDEIERRLIACGAAPGMIVGLLLERSPDFIAAAIALWRIGAAYLPLDPAYPEERLAIQIEDSKAAMIVSTTRVRARAGADVARLNLDAQGDPRAAPAPSAAASDDCAYVIFTSGSTGRPKGVEITHQSLSNFMTAMAKRPGLAQGQRMLALTTPAFDISLLEMFLPLTVGGAVVIASADDAGDPYRLLDLVESTRPDAVQATPSTWRMLIDSGWEGAPLKALCGGEALPAALAGELLSRVSELWNMYGPTETTIWSACRRIESPDDISIGAPIDNTTLCIVDRLGNLQPRGVAGELLIGGDGVSPGYLGRPDLTAERFIADRLTGTARLYRTGDLARWRPDGEIEILGRIDAQVKLRGFRIELEEIEKALERHDAVAKAAAAVRPDASGEPTLVAYIVYRAGQSATASELRRFLKGALPDYMAPQIFTELSALPQTANGKLDRKALPAPSVSRNAGRTRTPPQTELEKALAELWSTMLAAPEISITDNFFDLGGQSIQAARMTALFREKTGRRISPRSVMFETLQQLAANASTG